MDRLGPQDLWGIWPEQFGWPFDIGGLAILDGKPLLKPHGEFRIEAAREAVARKLHLVPRMRQLLYQPRLGLGSALWVDAPSFDIADHVRVDPLAPPGDEEQLLEAWGALRARPLDHSRPLWEMWFLTGLPAGRVGVFFKLHHAIADGVAGVATFASFLDLEVDAAPMPASPWRPQPSPTRAGLLRDALRRHGADFARTLAKLVRLPTIIRQIRRGRPAVSEFFLEGRAPRTSLNRPIGSHRRLTVLRSRLNLIKDIAHREDAKVNDVLLAAIAGGLRDLLRARGERVEGLVLRAVVAVSLHTERSGEAVGNVDGAMVVPLPIGESDPVKRLRLIAAATAERKKKARPSGGTVFRYGFLQSAFLRLYPRQRLANVYVANVPGPPIPLYFAKARLIEVFPLIPILGNLTIGVGALSYVGQFNLTVIADRDLCRDVDIFVSGVQQSLDDLSPTVETPRATAGNTEELTSQPREVMS